MTGRELIIYILQNKLEDKTLLDEDRYLKLATEEEVAVRFDVSIPTIKAYQELGILNGIKSNNLLYFLKTTKGDGNEKFYHICSRGGRRFSSNVEAP